MRVLLVTPTVNRGGVSLVVRKVFQGLADYAPSDWCFDILGQGFNEILEPVVYPKKFKFTQIEPVVKLPPHPHQFGFLWGVVQTFYQHLARLAPEYDLIYCAAPFWLVRAKDWILPVPFITHIPDLAFDEIRMGNLLDQHFRLCTRLIKERAVMTVFPSEYWRQHAVRKYGYDKNRTQVISHSADFVAENYDPSPQEAFRVKEKYQLPKRYILAMHPLYHKQPADILRAQKFARSNSPNVPPLVFAGIGTEQLLTGEWVDDHIEDVRDVLREVGANRGMDFFCIGRIPDEDIAGLYAGAVVSINASKMEGDLSGNTFNSFMAHCPHIYSDIPVYLQRIGRNQYGYTFKTGKYVDLGKRIAEVCNQSGEARERAEAAYGYAMSRTVKDVALEYIDVFKRVMEK